MKVKRLLFEALLLLAMLLGPTAAKAQFPVQCIDYATIEIRGGGTEIITCEGDGLAETYDFRTSTLAMPFGYLITDENNIILQVSIDNTLSFEGLGQGNFRVWAFAWLGQVIAQPGQDATTAPLGTICGALTTNFIPVLNFVPNGGEVTTVDGATEAFVCPEDGISDVISFASNGDMTASYAYLLTTADNGLIAVLDGNTYDFDLLGEGAYRVWGLAFSGDLLIMPGEDVTASALASGCAGLSNTFVEITRDLPDGGLVALADGSDSALVCVDDGQPDELTFTKETAAGAAYAYLITEEDGTVLDIVEGDAFDFEDSPTGTCLVYGLSYTGALTVVAGDNINVADLSAGCFSLSSNFITVVRQEADGGTVAFEDGTDEAFACVGDGVADVLSFTNTSMGADSYTYIVTDEENTILAVAAGSSFDFEGAETGVCRIWGLAYGGALLAMEGDALMGGGPLADGCFGLSENFLTVRRESVMGGTILADGSEGPLFTCPSDGSPDLLAFTTTGGSTGEYTYLVTTADLEIIGFAVDGAFDFDGLAAGTYLAWGLAYSGTLTADAGEDAGGTALSDECFDLSDNAITVIVEAPEGGSVATAQGVSMVFTCPGDGRPDVVAFDSTGTSQGAYVYVVTDEANVILALVGGDSYDFDEAPEGNCRVWGLAYTGSIVAEVGDTASVVALSDDCFDLSDNFVTVVRETPEGGQVALASGDTTVITCPGDGMADLLSFDSTNTSSGPYAYVVTDEENIILGFADGDSYDFDGGAEGICRVWGLAYTGSITAVVGDTASVAALSDDCFDLSDNFITVIRQVPVGGQITIEDGGNLIFICPGDGQANLISFDSTGVTGPAFTYLAVDQEGLVLDAFEGDTYDFDNGGLGIVRVYGLAYTGNLTAAAGDTLSTAALSDDCFSLSENFVDIVREIPFGGEVATESGETIVYTCPGDGVADLISFDSAFAAITPFTYIITDDQNVILDIPTGDTFDFDGAPVGTCRVWGLSYTGNITAVAGDTASIVALTDGCFDLSDNFVAIIREVPEGGNVALAGGGDTAFTCPGDDVSDLISADSTMTSSGPYTYIITDENNVILEVPSGDTFDFDSAMPAVCRIWGVAYTGNFTAAAGDDAAATALSDDCFDLSDNFITVVRETPEGGMVSIADEDMDMVTLCPGDGNADILTFSTTGSSNYTYVLTDTNDVVTLIIDGNSFDFDLGGIGVSRVYGLAYTGALIFAAGDTLTTAALSDDCFDLSDNFLTIVRDVPAGGVVRAQGGDTLVYACPGNGTPDPVLLDSAGVSGNYAYLLTDTNNIVLTIVPDSVDFDIYAPNVYRIWGLSYAGNITPIIIGADVLQDVLADDCYAVSENFVTIISQQPEGGMVSLESGESSLLTCPGDGMADLASFDSTGAVGLYTYLLTDEQNIIVEAISGDSYDFENLPEGVSRVWGLAYTGNLTVVPGEDAATAMLSDDCFGLSENFVTITRLVPDAGVIGTIDGPVSLELCVGDGAPDEVTFTVIGATPNPGALLITDENDFIVSSISGVFDFEGIVPGIYRVYNISYTGNITILPGANLFDDVLSDGCFDVTDQFVEINAIGVDGGIILTEPEAPGDQLSICPGDGVSDLVQFISSSATNADYTFALTNENDVILGFLPNGEFDFDLAGTGISKIWGISYTGNLLLNIGQNINNGAVSDGCFDLADNVITILRDQPEGGMVMTAAGETETLVCLGPTDGTVAFATSSTSVNAYTYLLASSGGIIIDVIDGDSYNFASLPLGDYRVYGLSYTGVIADLIGNDIESVSVFSNSCFELSSNFLTVTRGGVVDGGTLSVEGTDSDTVYLCPLGDEPDFIVINTSSTDDNYRYVITNANNQVIVDDIASNIIDFSGAAPGVYHVWGVGLEGDMILGFGSQLPDAPASASCFEYSDNFITVVYEGTEAGTVFTSGGADLVEVTVGDTIPDLLSFIRTGAAANVPYMFVVTDDQNSIIDMSPDGVVDFTDSEVGTFRVYGLSYTGTLFGFPGTDITQGMLSSDCFDLSSNFVTVNCTEALPIGGGAPQGILAEGGVPVSAAIEVAAAPNPATDWLALTFSLDASAGAAVARVVDSRGQLVQQIRLQEGAAEQVHRLDVSDWAPGLYLVYVEQGNAYTVAKVLVASR